MFIGCKAILENWQRHRNCRGRCQSLSKLTLFCWRRIKLSNFRQLYYEDCPVVKKDLVSMQMALDTDRLDNSNYHSALSYLPAWNQRSNAIKGKQIIHFIDWIFRIRICTTVKCSLRNMIMIKEASSNIVIHHQRQLTFPISWLFVKNRTANKKLLKKESLALMSFLWLDTHALCSHGPTTLTDVRYRAHTPKLCDHVVTKRRRISAASWIVARWL